MAFQKYLAEFVGTAILVIVGCGSVVLADFGAPARRAFCHRARLRLHRHRTSLQPRTGLRLSSSIRRSPSALAAGRVPARDVPGYIVAQLAGALAGTATLALLLAGRLKGYDLSVGGLGRTAGARVSAVIRPRRPSARKRLPRSSCAWSHSASRVMRAHASSPAWRSA